MTATPSTHKNNPLDILEEDWVELCRLLQFYKAEADRCKKHKIYLAGCIMAASAMEASLLLMVNAYQAEALSANSALKKPKKVKPLLKWSLAELLAVAKAANWLPAQLKLSEPWNLREAKIGDYAEVVRQIRNLVHPSCYVKENYQKRITDKHLRLSLEVFSYVSDWLFHKINKDIMSEMKNEGLK